MEQCGQLFTTDCVIRKCAHIGFRSNLLTSKRKGIWGSLFNVCFDIMKILLHEARSISRQGVAHLFFDVQSPLFVEFFEHRGTITSNAFCETLQTLCRSIKNKDRSCNNACPHLTRVTHTKWAKFKWEQLDFPPYRHVTLFFPCVWSPEKTSERAALQLG